MTDTGGLLVGAEVHPADVQDRDGARLVIEAIHQLFPWLRHRGRVYRIGCGGSSCRWIRCPDCIVRCLRSAGLTDVKLSQL